MRIRLWFALGLSGTLACSSTTTTSTNGNADADGGTDAGTIADDAATGALPKACSLVTNAELAASFGQTVTQADGPASTTTQSICNWTTGTAANGSLRVEAGDESLYEMTKAGSEMAVGPTEAVAGIGTSAYFGYQAKSMVAVAHLGFTNGKYVVVVSVADLASGLTKADAMTRAKASARAALGRLK
jgi:hypothetical protein